MPYCLNPACTSPKNSVEDSCETCGTMLWLHQRYQALKPIGQGGFGRTFLAVDLSASMKPRCVIKQLYPQQKGGDIQAKASDLFRQEAQQLKLAGQYPSIPTFLDYFEQEGFQYLVQEYIEGQNLAEILATGRHFTESEVRVLLETMLETLDFLHNHQIIHRDIKPANIIQTLNGRFVLVDLGAAKLMTGTALGQTGTVIGSAEYVAPEQLRGKAIFASDLYSLGATCVTLLTGMSPFSLFDTSTGSWEWRDYLVQNPVSDSFGKVLDRLLVGPTKQRYRSADEVWEDLIVKPELLKGKQIDPWHLPEEDPKGRPWTWEPSVETEEKADDWRLPLREAAPTDELKIETSPPGEVVGTGGDRADRKSLLPPSKSAKFVFFLMGGIFMWPIGALIMTSLNSTTPAPEAPAPTAPVEQNQTSEKIDNKPGEYKLSELIKPDHKRFIKPYKVIKNLPSFSHITVKNSSEIIFGKVMKNRNLTIWNLDIEKEEIQVKNPPGTYKNVDVPYEVGGRLTVHNNFLMFSAYPSQYSQNRQSDLKIWNMENNKFMPVELPQLVRDSASYELDESGFIRSLSQDGSLNVWKILQNGQFVSHNKFKYDKTVVMGQFGFSKDLRSIFTVQGDSKFYYENKSYKNHIIQQDLNTSQVISKFPLFSELGIPFIGYGEKTITYGYSQALDKQFLVVSSMKLGIPGLSLPEIPGFQASNLKKNLSKLNPYTRGEIGYQHVDLEKINLGDETGSQFYILDVDTKKILHSFSRPGQIREVRISPDTNTLIILEHSISNENMNIASGTKFSLTVWDLHNGRFLREMNIMTIPNRLSEKEANAIGAINIFLDFTPDGKKLILGVPPSLGFDGTPLPKGLDSGISIWSVDELRNP
jgi:serine/threonine protein kinase